MNHLFFDDGYLLSFLLSFLLFHYHWKLLFLRSSLRTEAVLVKHRQKQNIVTLHSWHHVPCSYARPWQAPGLSGYRLTLRLKQTSGQHLGRVHYNLRVFRDPLCPMRSLTCLLSLWHSEIHRVQCKWFVPGKANVWSWSYRDRPFWEVPSHSSYGTRKWPQCPD